MASVVVGVPNLDEVSAFYTEFGLVPAADGWFASADGGNQLRLVPSSARRLVGFTVGVDDEDDLGRAAARLEHIGVAHRRAGRTLTSRDPATGTTVTLEIQERVAETALPPTPYNGPGRIERAGTRAPGLITPEPVRPSRLGHVVLGSAHYPASLRYFVEGVGFKVSDIVKEAGSFMRVTTDHHNLLLLRAPVNFLHHTAWQVADVDEVGRGAYTMLEQHPERHIWGLGRHHVGSNFFWYLKDPAGNFCEYYCDTDAILDDEQWEPGVFEGNQGMYNWGPPPPREFIQPKDLAALMALGPQG